MTQEFASASVIEVFFVATALAVVIVLASQRYLSASSLRGAPRRATGLRPLDLLVAFLLLLLAGQVAAGILEAAGVRRGAGAESPVDAVITALVGQVGIQVPVVLYVLVRASRRRLGLRHFGLLPRRWGKEMAMAGAALVVALPLVVGTNVVCVLVSQWLGAPTSVFGHQMLEVLRETEDARVVALLLVSALILAPLLEEIIFRGLAQTALLELFGRRRRWSVLLVAAGVFAVVHTGSAAWQVLPGLLVLGLVLGWLYERTGSLLPSVIVHMAFNAVMVAATLAVPAAPKHDVLAAMLGG